MEDNDRYGTYVYVPTAIAGLRCYVRRVAVSGNLSDASNLCVIKRDDSFFADRNYIRKRTFTGTGVNDRITDLTYYDGLGYPEQSVQVAASPQGKDLIIPITYDSMHRNDALSYLPYVGVNSNGKFDTDALTGQKNFYRALYPDESPYFYTENVYEHSPLDRVSERYRPGVAYRSIQGGKSTRFDYAANGPNEVREMDVDAADGSLNVYGYYPAGKLFRNSVRDEDGHTVITYSDPQDRIVMTSTVISAKERADTRFVYDDFGRLGWVITPEGMKGIRMGETYGKDSGFAGAYCYVYTYDGYGRITEKRSPGREPEYVVYDRRDRPVLTQDGNERGDLRVNPSPLAPAGEYAAWRRYEYDNFDRLRRVEHLYISSTLDCAAVQRIVDSRPDDYQDYLGAVDREALAEYRYDVSDAEVYYAVIIDSMQIIGTSDAGGHDKTVPDALAFRKVEGVVDASDMDERVRGLKTYEKLRVLAPGDAEEYIERAYYYDYRGRPVQTVERNRLGFITRTSRRYDFAGNLLAEAVTAKVIENAEPDTKTALFTYDHRRRPLTERTALNGSDTVRTTYGYDRLGRLVTRTYGPVTRRNYYNLQGWLTGTDYFSRYGSIRPDTSLLRESLFSSVLRYYDPQHRQSVPSFTGNVSEWHWTHGNPGGDAEPQMSMYRYSYDGASRLTESSYGNRLLTTERKSETGISYDRNGNLLTLRRYGTSDAPDHDLSYSYDGNRLVSLSDKKMRYAFGYDSNGNLVSDSRKGLIFGYNALNLLKEVKDSDGVKRAVYAYASDGTKLAAVDNSVSGYEYVGPFVYRRYRNRLTLESTAFTGGRLRAETTSQGLVYRPIYFLADHLGSVRVVLDSSGKVLERNDYYPFGTRWTMPPQAMTDNRYRYEGKEEQQLAGINLLDYGSRLYDPFRGQWTSQDPLSENYYSHSPYSFCANNPIAILDPNGEDWYRLWLDPEQLDEEAIQDPETERWYKMVYSTDIRSQKDLDKAEIKGEYLGLTHTSGNRYYSLLGETQDLSTTEGKLYRKVDEAIIKSYRHEAERDPLNVELDYEAPTDFSGILPFNRNPYTGANNNVHPYENSYFGSTMYFMVYEDKMLGRYTPPSNVYQLNRQLGMNSLTPGYIAYIRVAGSDRNNIIQLVFSTKEILQRYQNRISELKPGIKR